MDTIVDTEKIEFLLNDKSVPGSGDVNSVIEKAKKLKGLSLEDVSALIKAGNEEIAFNEILHAAREVKEACFGKRVVLFAPMYLTSECINNCLYCGFSKDNEETDRNTLTENEVIREAGYLEKMGFNRLLLVAGESPKSSSIEKIEEAVKAIYDHTDVRIVHVNAAPMSLDNLKRLKKSGIGVYQVFQETYHEETYQKVHVSGPKRDYHKRLNALDLAMEAGLDDVGIGALLGLYDWRFEVMAVVSHATHLFRKYKAWPHTISVPRLQPAVGSPMSSPPYEVTDRDFKLICAIYRLAVPTAGVVVSTREPESLRDEVLKCGVSQISAGSRTDPGGYSRDDEHYDASQFKTNDHRSLEEMVEHIAKSGDLPSLCTSCYRVGRTGSVFTDTVSHEEMARYCLPNSLLTLKEFTLDHANGSRKLCEEVIEKNISNIEDEKLRKATVKKLAHIERGKRDLFF